MTYLPDAGMVMYRSHMHKGPEAQFPVDASSPSAQQRDRCAPPVLEEIHFLIREEADNAAKCLRVVDLPGPADEDRGAGTESGNARKRLRHDEKHGPEGTDVTAGATHQQQPGANQQQP